MPLTRQFLRSVCRLLIGMVLLAQLAVSAYACPGRAGAGLQILPAASAADGRARAAEVGAAQPMADCDDMAGAMDPSFASLCAAHCHQGQQSDHVATLTVPAALPSAFYVAPPAPEPIAAPRSAADAVTAGAAVPHTILHCCFRI